MFVTDLDDSNNRMTLDTRHLYQNHSSNSVKHKHAVRKLMPQVLAL